jgi:hypothetical protein
MFTSILRTVVPALWGAFIGWAIGLLPILEPHREALLEYGTPLSAIVAAVLIGAWYAFWRWLEPRLPDWLTRAVLGSAKTPVYEGKHLAVKQGFVTIENGGITIYDSRERPKE